LHIETSKTPIKHLELIKVLLKDTHVALVDHLLCRAGSVESTHNEAAFVVGAPAEQWLCHCQEALRRQLLTKYEAGKGKFGTIGRTVRQIAIARDQPSAGICR
jgi:hypothetical protein